MSTKSTGRTSPEWLAAERQKNSFLETLQQLVTIESGSRDLEGLGQLAALVGRELSTLGMTVQIEASYAPDFHPLLRGAALGPTVLGRKFGRGSRKILLIAHMDTVYPRGSANQKPFHVEGDRAFGLGISDDKAGVALILHTIDLLQRLGFDDYAELAVFLNGDEEIGSPGSGPKLVELGSQYDAVFSFEGGGGKTDWVRLAIYELAHQILKTRNLGDPQKGLKINWTVVEGGGVRNVIPAKASAIADIRSLTNEDLDLMEAALRASIEEKLIPDTKTDLSFYRSRPAFVPNDVSLKLARHAQVIFNEVGLALEIRDRATGGGTDAAFAGQRPKGGVLESFGLRGFGAHSNGRESIMIDSIVPRLYLATKMIMDVGSGKVSW